MKKVLLLLFSFFIFSTAAVLAYETVIVDFPPGEGWHPVYYAKKGDEAIVQYVPGGQTNVNWIRSLIFHSYKNDVYYNSATKFIDITTSQMELRNSQPYRYLKYSDNDSIATRCTPKTKTFAGQCEIYRVSNSYEGLISMHYVNKDMGDFKNTYNKWYEIVKTIRIYYSYYRDDRILDKAIIFEL